MRLIGRYDSPFVRRVGISLHLLGLKFEQLPLSVFSDAAEVRKFSPLGRVPVLVLADGEVLVDSVAILDHLDEVAGPGRRLIPAAQQSADWVDRCRVQIEAALGELEAGWSTATKATQAEITTATMLAYGECLEAFRACPLPERTSPQIIDVEKRA